MIGTWENFFHYPRPKTIYGIVGKVVKNPHLHTYNLRFDSSLLSNANLSIFISELQQYKDFLAKIMYTAGKELIPGYYGTSLP